MTTTATIDSSDGKSTKKSLKAPPRLSGGLPLLGHTVGFIRDTVGLLERAKRECGDVAAFHVVGKDMVLLTGPEHHEAFFRTADEVLSPSEAYKMMVPVFGKGVAYDNPPKRMMEQLHMLLPALQDKRMRTYGKVVGDETEAQLATWGEKGTIDFYEFCQTLTNFTSAACLLGPEFRKQLTGEFAEVYHDLERSIVPIAYISPNLPIPAFKKRDRARARLGEMVSEIVENRRRSGFVGEDFLQTLMEARYEDGKSLTDFEITGLLIAAMFAGHHTSSVTTAWTLFELLQHPEHLKKVIEEVDRVVGEDPQLTYPSLRKLEYTEWAVKEALRLHPPLFILLRAAQSDTEINGYEIKKGTWCVVSPMLAHRDDRFFKGSDAFDPTRYGPGRAEDKKPFTYIAFGGGRHKCMGNAFAILQIKTIVAILLSRYEFELAGDEIIPDFQGLVIGPRMPCRVRYRARQRASAEGGKSA